MNSYYGISLGYELYRGNALHLNNMDHTMRDRFWRWIAWRLPRRLTMWAAIRVAAHATQGKWSNQEVPALSAMDALKRWDEQPA